ncbi:MAG: hypothetical protein HUJ31_12640 [Pseudomonadales bacterium]|nr:hypothetical protein [Pseudomonadales bacterium]
MITDVLTSIAEIAITLAGFTGLLVAFRSSRTSVSEELRRIAYIFAFCFVAVVGSFLPTIAELFAPDTALPWKLPLGFVAVSALLIGGIAIVQSLQQRITVRFPIVTYSMVAVLLTVGSLLFLVLFEAIPGNPFGYLLVGVLWCVAHAGYLFVSTLFWARVD